MDFNVDLFISYAHIDNEALSDKQEGWIAQLHRVLEIRLAQLLGEKPTIWRDPKLQGNDFFDETIIEHLDGAAALVSILSPRYVKSEWCQREALAFVEAAAQRGGVRVADKARIFKVVKTPVPLEEHPASMRNLLGYDFYQIDPETGRAREFNVVYGSEAEQQYWAHIEDLAYDIRDLLDLLKQEHTASNADAPTVFLAETTYDLTEQRNQIRRELLQRGYTVLPDRALPLRSPDLVPDLRADLERADLSIHLIGAIYGVVPEAETRSLGELQNAIAAERSHTADLPRLLWMPPNLTSNDERQQVFIDALTNDPTVQFGADLLQTPLEDLKTIIEDKIQQQARQAPSPASASASASTDDTPPLLYLICDVLDEEAVQPLVDYFFEQGLEVTLPLFEGDESEVREDHQESLRLCDAVLIYYGQASEAWLRSKLRDLRKAPGYGRSQPFATSTVFLADPATPQKARFRTREVDAVLSGLDGFGPTIVADFLNTIHAFKGGSTA